MELVFNKIDNFYVSEFQINSDFNLHIERDIQSVLRFYQRTADGGKWDVIQDLNNQVKNLIIDYDCSALIYPKWIKIECEVLPIYAAITTDGEVTEIKTHSKEIEITSNGTADITPDAGFAYLNSVKVKTNVPMSGGRSVSSWRYFDVSKLDSSMKPRFYPFIVRTNDRIIAVEAILDWSTVVAIGVDDSPMFYIEGTTMSWSEMMAHEGFTAEMMVQVGIVEITKDEFYNFNA